METQNDLHDIKIKIHKDLHELIELLRREKNEEANILLRSLLVKYRPYEAQLPDDYGVLYEADFYLREETSTLEDVLVEYNRFLRQLYHPSE